jgi:hypothetical protein
MEAEGDILIIRTAAGSPLFRSSNSLFRSVHFRHRIKFHCCRTFGSVSFRSLTAHAVVGSGQESKVLNHDRISQPPTFLPMAAIATCPPQSTMRFSSDPMHSYELSIRPWPYSGKVQPRNLESPRWRRGYENQISYREKVAG